ncbi:MAG TPA: hypothetical protein V6D19_04990, partial [Stenomitos sp.]
EISDVQIVHQLLSQLGIKTQFRWTVNHPHYPGIKIRVFSLNERHWETCWGILSRRAERRERIQETPSESDLTRSPIELSDIETTGDLVQNEETSASIKLERKQKRAKRTNPNLSLNFEDLQTG